MKQTFWAMVALVLALAGRTAQAADGDFIWAKAMGGVGAQAFGNSVAVDASGNVYTTGSFYGTVDFHPGANTFNLTSAGSEEFFVSKLDADGLFVWAIAIGGAGTDKGNSVAVDVSGNVYTTGTFNGTVDFDPGAGTFNLTSAGGPEIFVSKLDTNGNFLWAKAMGGVGNDMAFSLALDATENVYTTGRFDGTADFDPDAGTFNLTSAGVLDIFISKLDASGNFVWAKALGGVGEDYGYSLAVDTSGNVYTTGYFEDTVDFDPGAATNNLSAVTFQDIFISKLDTGGNFVWAKAIGGPGSDEGYSIALDASGNVFTTGFFSNTVDFDPGAGTFTLISVGFDIFVSKLDTDGNFVWAKALGGAFTDYGKSIAVDASGNVCTTGFFLGTADFDPGAGTFELTAAGLTDSFVSKLDANGNFVWAKAIGGADYDEGLSVALDASRNVYTSGYFGGTVDFDPGAGAFNLSAAGSYDIFVLKLEGGGAPHIADVNGDGVISLSELLRLIQFFNIGALHCDALGVDGFNPGIGDTSCVSHSSDYNPQNWIIELNELLRLIQFFNLLGYYSCPGVGEDDFCAGAP